MHFPSILEIKLYVNIRLQSYFVNYAFFSSYKENSLNILRIFKMFKLLRFGAVPVVKSEPIGEAVTSSRDVVFALLSLSPVVSPVSLVSRWGGGVSPAPCTYVNKYEGT